MTEKIQADIKFYNASKGFGFTDNADDGKSYFVHESEVEKGTKLFDGDRIEFEASEGDKGPRAVSVKKIAKPEIPDNGASDFEQNELNDASVQFR